MGQTVKLRRSAVSGRVPINSQLQLGELSVNTADGKLFFAKSGSYGPSIEEIITTNTQNTGSIDLVGALTASVVSSSFKGDGSELYNIPASGVVGLSLDRISSDGAVAAITAELFDINVNTVIQGSLTATEIAGSGLGLTNVPINISGSSHTLTNYDGLFTKIYFDESTGIKVEGDTSTGIAKIYLDGVASDGGGGVGSTKFIEVTTPSSTWTFNHGLGEKYPSIMVFDSDDNVIIPQNIEVVSTTQLVVSFASPQIGYATATVGGGLPATALTDNKTLVTVSGVPTWKDGILSGSVSFNSFSSSIDTIIGSLETESSSIRGDFNAHTLSLNTYTSSNNSIVVDLVSETGSYQLKSNFNTYTSSISAINNIQNARIGSLEGFTASIDDTYATDQDVTTLRGDLNIYTSSNDGKINSLEIISSSHDGRLDTIESQTGSYLINSDLSTLEGQVSSLETETGSIKTKLSSIESTTSSFDGRLDSLEIESGSVDGRLDSIETTTSSLDGRLDSVEIKTGSIGNRLGSIEITTGSLKGRISSLETESGSVDGRLDSLETESGSVDGRLDSVETTTGSLKLRISSLEIESGSVDGRLDSVEITTGSLKGKISSLETTTASLDGRLDSVEITTGSLKGRIGSLESFTASIDDTYATDQDVTTLRGDLNIYTSSNDTNISNLQGFQTDVEGGLQFTGSNVTIKGNLLVKGTETRVNSTTVEVSDNVISLNGSGAANGGIEVRDVTSPGVLSGSLIWDGLTNKWKGGTKGNEDNLVLEGGFNSHTTSINAKIGSLESFTASIDDTYATDQDVTTLRGDLNTYTSSNNTTNTTQNNRLGSLETSTSSLNSFTSSINTTIKSKMNTEGVISSSLQINHDLTTNFSVNEHIDHSSVSIGSGKGLEGGGTIDTNRSLSLHTGSLHFLDGVKSKLNTETVVSGSIQIDITGTTNYNLVDGRLGSLETESGSVDGRLDTIESQTGSYQDGYNYSQVGHLPLSGGTITGNVKFNDDIQTIWGTGNDLKAWHNGINSYLFNYNGGLFVGSRNGDLSFLGSNGSTGEETYFFLDGSQRNINFQKDAIFTDNKKVLFGGSGDLQIYHDGSNSRIDETGTGSLIVKTGALLIRNPSDASMIDAQSGGAVNLYYNGVKKLETTNTGVTVTGVIGATGGSSTDWNTAFGWGNHASVGYLTSYINTNEFTTGATFNSTTGVITFTRNNGGGIYTVDIDGKYSESGHTHTFASLTSKPTTLSGYGITDAASGTNVPNWDAAFGWGNHASVGYITGYTEVDTLDSVTSRGSSTTNDITIGKLTSTWGEFTTTNNANPGVDDLNVSGFGVLGNRNINPVYLHNFGDGGIRIGVNTTLGDAINGVYITDTISTFYMDVTVTGVITATGGNSTNWNTAYGWGNHANTYSLLNHVHTFASLTSKPTTLSGYGITDAATSAQGTKADTSFGWGNHASVGYLTSYNNEYTTGVTFNSVDGVLTFTRNDGDTFNVDIDGRFSLSAHNHDGDYIRDGGSTAIGDINTIGTESIKHRWNNTTIGRPASSQSNEYGTVTTLTYDGLWATQIAWDIHDSNLYGRTLDVTNNTGTWSKFFTDSNFTDNSSNWNTAFGWGNHASAGYQAGGNYFTDGDTVLNMANNDGLVYDDAINVMYLKLDGINREIYHTGNFTDSSSNWNTAYTDRNKWDGGATGLNASTGRVSLGLGTAATLSSTEVYKDGDIIMNENPFGGRKLYRSSLNNPWFLAADRWTVTQSGGSNIANAFNGDYESGYSVVAGGSATFNIDFNGVHPGYPYGYIYLSFYYSNQPSVISGRVYNTYAPHTVGWSDLVWEEVVTGTYQRIVRARQSKYGLTNVEITLTAPSGTTVSLTACEISLDRPGTQEMPVLNKFKPQTLYKNLTINANVTANNLNISNWNTAYGWGNHASAGYLTTYNNEYTTGVTWTAATATLTFTRNDGDTYNVQMLETLTDVTVTGGTYASGTQILTLTKSDGTSVDVSGFAIDTDVNWYTTGATFNTGNGIITGTNNNGGTWTVDIDNRYLQLGGGTLTGNLTLNSVNPEILFNGTSDAGVDMAIKATPEGLDFYEPEDGNKIHFQILDDTGVNATFGLQIGGTQVLSSSRVLSNVTGNISMFTNDSNYLTSFTETDPIFTASPSFGITNTNITNWNAAFGWGDHAGLYSLLNHTHTFASLTSKPTTLSGYGITDGATSSHTHTFASLTSKPTTLSGYGITDAATSSQGTKADTAYGWGNHASGGYLTTVPNTLRQGTTLLDTGIEYYDENSGGDLSWAVGADDRGGIGVAGQNAFVIRYNRGTRFTDGGWRNEGTESFTIDDSGNVGVGTPQAQITERLNVEGNLRVTGTLSASGYNDGNWNTSYGWGNHASAGYISSFTDTNEFTTGSTFNSANGVITFTRNNGGDTYTVGIDGRYLPLAGGTMTGDLTIDNNTPQIDFKSDQSGVNVGGRIELNENGNLWVNAQGGSDLWLNWLAPTSPTSKSDLQVGDGNAGGAILTVQGSTRRVGINNTAPTQALDVSGNIVASGTVTATGGNSTQWNTAYGWGNHASVGYLTSYVDTWRGIHDTPVDGATTISISSNWAFDNVKTPVPSGALFTDTVYVLPFTNNSTNWNTAYGWGNHASAGYLTSYTDTNTTYTAGSGLLLSGTTLRLNGGEIASGVDLNTMRTTGVFSQNSNGDATAGTNWPVNAAGILEVWNDDYGNGIHCTQRYSQYNTTDVYNRNYYNGTWTAWRNLTQDTDTVYVLPFTNNSGNWNTAYGWGNHASAGYQPGGNYLLDTTDTFTGSLTINGDIRGNGQQLILNAGESYSYATGQTAENVYINAEAGLIINSSPDNWSSGWVGRSIAYINRADGTSSLPGLLSVTGHGDSNQWNTAYGWGNHASAGYAATSHDHNKIVENSTITYGQGSLQWMDISGVGGSGLNGANASNPSNDWYHHLIMNHANSSGYYFDLAGCFHSDTLSFRRNVGGTLSDWRRVWHSGDFTSTNTNNWDTAYGWGDHSTEGYITGFTDTNEFVTGATFNSGTGVVTFTRNNGGDIFTLNLAATLTDVTVTGGTYTSATQTLRLTKSDGNTVDVSGFAIDTDENDNNYTTGATFNTGNGIITGTLNGGATWTVDIDGKYAESSHTHTGVYVSSFPTTSGDIDLDWGQSFKTFDPIPTGTPPIQSPNLRTINVGENFDRRTQLAFNYSTDQAWFRRRDSSGWQTWREFIHTGNIATQSVSYATNAGTLDGVDSTQFLRSDADDSFSGKLISTNRAGGIVGTYSSSLTDQVWSMGAAYLNAADGSNFGGLYGIAYKHTNNTTGGSMAGGHQIVFVNNGTAGTSIGLNGGIWTSGQITTTSHGNSSNWNTAYTYSTVGHLPLAGGTMTGSITLPTSGYVGLNGGTTYGIGVHTSNRNSGVFDTIESTGTDTLELNYYNGGAVKIGSGANGSKSLYAVGIYDNGNQVYHSGIFTNNSTNWNTAYGWGDHAGLYSLAGHTHSYLPLAGGTLTGDLVIQHSDATDGILLHLRNDSNGSGSTIKFSDQTSTATQHGLLSYYHSDGASYGSGNVFVFDSTEANMSFVVKGKVMYSEGIYTTPATGTGAGTRKDTNWDTAYGWGNHDGLYSLVGHTQSFSTITNRPTTVSGYGITDMNLQSVYSATNLIGLGWIQSTSVGTSYTTNYQVRENSGGGGNTSETFAPQLAFHWSGVVASSIMMEASGRIAIRNNPGGSYENFVAAVITATGGNSTQWNTAYTYSTVGHLTSSSTLNASNMTTGTLPDVFSASTRYNIGLMDGNGDQTRDKLRVWNGSEYTIGMKSSYSYGSLGTGGDGYAMSFQMSNTTGRGFWWGDTSHSDAQGAMSLTTDGILTVAKSISIGQGETITAPSTTPLYVEGSVSGSTVFEVQGTQGQLFSITDDLTGDIFEVSDISGIPILTVNASGLVTIDDTLRVTGDVIAYSASDSRLKENITPIKNPLDKIKLIGGYEFDWNDLSKNSGHDVGVIAQEIESVLPELVSTRGDGFKGVKYDKLTALLIEAVKEQQLQIDELKSKLNK